MTSNAATRPTAEERASLNAQTGDKFKRPGQDKAARTLLDKWKLVSLIQVDAELSFAARVVASNLMWRTNCKWQSCFPKQTTIAADLGMSKRAVVDAVRQLSERGWITITLEGKLNHYRFCWDRLTDAGKLSPEVQEMHSTGDGEAIEGAENALGEGAKSAPHNTGSLEQREEPSLSQAQERGADAPRGSASPSAEAPSWELVLTVASGTNLLWDLPGEPQEGTSIEIEAGEYGRLYVSRRSDGKALVRGDAVKHPLLKEVRKADVRVKAGAAGSTVAPATSLNDEVFRVLRGEFMRRWRISDKASRGRTAGLIREGGLARVAEVMRETLEHGPAGDPFDYAAGILRGEGQRGGLR